MSREVAIAAASEAVDSGQFPDLLARRVAYRTESQNADSKTILRRYLDSELGPSLEGLGFQWSTHDHEGWPFLIAERSESPSGPTILSYGHGDVVLGMEDDWEDGLSPWVLAERKDRWYGRGAVDNKGQHTINLLALEKVIETRGSLGFNAKFLFEMGEEVLSPGLHAFAAAHADELTADLFLASDGPRVSADRATLFLGSRGALSFDIWIDAREGSHHSGNWGGLLSDPAMQLASAIACIAGPNGRIRIPEWLPSEIPRNVRNALANCEITTAPGDPLLDPEWGEPDLTLSEKVYAWSSFCVLAFEAGNPRAPVGAIPGRAWARCQLRFVVGVEADDILPSLRRHLETNGFDMVQVAPARTQSFRATRLDPSHPWATWCVASVLRTTQRRPALLPSFGGSLPNDVFFELLDLPTVWIPHSYPACSQHAPNEHLPVAIAREGLAIMAGLYWDLGGADTEALTSAPR